MRWGSFHLKASFQTQVKNAQVSKILKRSVTPGPYSFGSFAQGLRDMHAPLEYLMIALYCPNVSNKERNKIWSSIIDQWIQHNHQVTRSAVIFQDALKTLCERSKKSIKNSEKSPAITLDRRFRLRV